jgi:hypothetical protein
VRILETRQIVQNSKKPAEKGVNLAMNSLPARQEVF